MEIRGAMKEEKKVVVILMIGCIVSTIPIITSVDYLFKEKRYIELGFASFVFLALIFIARKMKSDYQRLEELEKEFAN